MNSATDDDINPKSGNSKAFPLFAATSNLVKKTEKKDYFDDMTPTEKTNENDIFNIENKFNELLTKGTKGQEEIFQRVNHVTLNEFKIPNKKMTTEQKIIIRDMNEKEKKQKENEQEIQKENQLKRMQKKKDEKEIIQYYKDVKETKRKIIDKFVKKKTRSFKMKLIILAIVCLFIAFLLFIYLIVEEKIFDLIFG